MRVLPGPTAKNAPGVDAPWFRNGAQKAHATSRYSLKMNFILFSLFKPRQLILQVCLSCAVYRQSFPENGNNCGEKNRPRLSWRVKKT